VKWPRFTFEKFPNTSPELTVQMKSVGEAMAIGRTFKESLQKAIRSLEIDRYSLDNRYIKGSLSIFELKKKLRTNCWDKIWYVAEAIRRKLPVDEIFTLTKIDPWFLNNIKDIVRFEEKLKHIQDIRQKTKSGRKCSGLSNLLWALESGFRGLEKGQAVWFQR